MVCLLLADVIAYLGTILWQVVSHWGRCYGLFAGAMGDVVDLRMPCWKTGESLSSTKIFFCSLRILNHHLLLENRFVLWLLWWLTNPKVYQFAGLLMQNKITSQMTLPNVPNGWLAEYCGISQIYCVLSIVDGMLMDLTPVYFVDTSEHKCDSSCHFCLYFYSYWSNNYIL